MKPVTANALADRFDWMLDWLFPPRCRACGVWLHGRDAEYFCSSCRLSIQLLHHPLCTLCGRPFPDASGDDHPCGACLSRAPQFIQARAWACYPREDLTEHPLRRVIQKFKYGRKVSLGKPLGCLLARSSKEFVNASRPQIIVPVPLHPKRLRWRGFNQSVLLARQVSRASRVPMDPFLLQRRRATAPQTQLAEGERRRNMRGAFALGPDKSVRGKIVLLLDDVYTSGATVDECSRVLNRGGAKAVYVLTLARAVS